MAMTITAEPINRDIKLFLDNLGERDGAAKFAEMARAQIADANATNAAAFGRAPPSTTSVDGRVGAALESATLRSVIFTEWELVIEALGFIGEQLELFSPVKTGRYKRSHILLADGTPLELDGGLPHFAEEYLFINVVPYARKIERGLSPQAPDGVYQAVAQLARRKFGKVAKISFTYRSITGGAGKAERNPAIVVRLA